MRSAAGPRIGFLSSPVGAPFRAQGGACSEESQRPESRAGPCGLDPGGQWRGRSVGSLIPRSTAASALASVGHRGPALTAVRGSPGLLGAQSRAGTALPHRLSRLCGPRATGRQGELPSMDTREAPSPCQEAWNKGCPSPEDVSDTSCSLGSGPQAPSVPASSQDVFTSSFSFIRLSLGSAGERGEAEGCPPSREAEGPRQSLEEMEAKAASSDGPHDHPRLLSLPFTLKASQSLADAAQTSGGSPGLECQTLPLLDTDAASSCSLDPLWFEASSPGDAHRWDPLLSKCEPALLHCLQGQRRRLENASSSLEELQVLQHLPLCSLPTSAPSKISATYLHFKNPSFDPSQAEVQYSISSDPERTAPKLQEGGPGYIAVLRQKGRYSEHQKIISVLAVLPWSFVDVLTVPQSCLTLRDPLDCSPQASLTEYSLKRLMLKLKLQYFGHLTLSKLRKLVMDREAWHAEVRNQVGVSAVIFYMDMKRLLPSRCSSPPNSFPSSAHFYNGKILRTSLMKSFSLTRPSGQPVELKFMVFFSWFLL
ncbi:hypothetical protein FD754_012659 [Muntiacus muntjak]|uniref:Uncharacterized protein n=1 Tax=Muntiacus muntjak TaxID=9888 RepID=A0A5N3VF86_MUNMU|nr:hypothetical protein FD754_012659 [Muntiacus muntjak]